MNRVVGWIALVLALGALAVALLSLSRSSRSGDVSPAPAGGAPSARGPAAEPRAGVASPSGLSPDESQQIAAAAIAAREREMVDRLWPRIAKLRAEAGLSLPEKPSKLDDLLALLLDFGGEEETDTSGRSPEVTAKVTACKNDLKQIGVYFALFESKNRHYPGSIEELKGPTMINGNTEKILVCPFDTSGDACSYEYLHPVRGDDEPYDSIMAYDRHPHPDGRRCVLHFQGRVDEMADSDFQKLLADQIAADRVALGEEIVKARAAAMDSSLSEAQRTAAQKRLGILQTLSR